MAFKFELLVDDVVDRIGSPGHWIPSATARTSTATPLIGKQHLGTGIVERRRVPVGKAVVGNGIDALGFARVADVKQYAIAGAGTRG